MKKLLNVWITIMTVMVMAAMNVYSQEEDGMKESVGLKKVKRFKSSYKGHFSPDGTKLVLKDNYEFRIVEIKTGKMICEFKSPSDRGFRLSLTKDWKKFAISFSTGEKTSYKVKVILGEVSTCKEIKTLYHKESKGTGKDLSFSGDGKKLALVSGFLRIIDVESGEEETLYEMDSFPEGYEPMSNLLSPDGKWLVIYTRRSVPPSKSFVPPGYLPALYVIDLESGERKLLSKNDDIETFEFSRDLKQLITYGAFVNDEGEYKVINDKGDYEGSKTKVYEVGSWKLLPTLEEDRGVFDVSPDSKFIAKGNWGEKKGTVSIHLLKTGEKLEEKTHYKRTLWDDLNRESKYVTRIDYIEFSPDGKMLATSGGGMVKLWKVERVKEKKKKRSWWRKIFRDER